MEGEAQRVTRGDRAFVTNRAEGISFGLPGEPVTLGSQRRIPTSQSWAYGFLSRKSYKPHHWVQRNLVSSFERFLCDPMVRLRGDMSLGTCRGSSLETQGPGCQQRNTKSVGNPEGRSLRNKLPPLRSLSFLVTRK